MRHKADGYSVAEEISHSAIHALGSHLGAAMLALLVANFGTTVAEFSGVEAAFSLAHIPSWLAVPPVAVGVWFLVTRGNYRKVERVFLALTAVYIAYFIAGFLARPDWGAAVHGTCVPLCAPKTTSRASMAAPRWLPSA